MSSLDSVRLRTIPEPGDRPVQKLDARSSDCEATVIRVLGPFEDNEERAEWISRCPDDETITLIKLAIDANGKPYLNFNE